MNLKNATVNTKNINSKWMLKYNKKTRTKKLDAVYKAVSQSSGIPIPELMGNNRTMPVTTARHIARYIAYSNCGIGLSEIARYEKCRHATIYHSCKIIKEWLDEPNFFIWEFTIYKKSLKILCND